ncbi:MAG: MBL fold metallo-hydrolase [Eubacteriales bacterium]|nr:MBL fold metallo-hydrolase [Eubacteriales bacterium]
MDLSICSFVSGSSGNCSFVAAGGTRLLVDAGISAKRIQDKLKQIGTEAGELHGILVTHEHSDHTKGIGVLARRYNLPVYATEGTWAGMQKCIGEIPPWQVRTIDAGDEFYIDDIVVSPFSVSHDANDPVGYRLHYGMRSVAVATDTGRITKQLAEQLYGVDFLLFESNHDPDMLKNNPNYPMYLKKRILGSKGHLSNEACANALINVCEKGTRHVLLGHLSQHNNTPELAFDTVSNILKEKGVQVGRDIDLSVADADASSPVFCIS